MALEEIAPILLFELLRNVRDQAKVEDQTQPSISVNDTLGIRENIEVDLNQKINKLTLCCQAMWELIQQNTNLTDSDLNRKVMEIDMRDGVNDNQLTPRPKKCPRCDSMISVKFRRCLFCGFEDQDASPLAGI